MNHQEFRHCLDELFEQDPGTVQPPNELQSLPGWSSLTFLGLLALLDEQYQVAARPDAILNCRTVADLTQYVEQLQAAARSAA